MRAISPFPHDMMRPSNLLAEKEKWLVASGRKKGNNVKALCEAGTRKSGVPRLADSLGMTGRERQEIEGR